MLVTVCLIRWYHKRRRIVYIDVILLLPVRGLLTSVVLFWLEGKRCLLFL
jgi:hypothetical protein